MYEEEGSILDALGVAGLGSGNRRFLGWSRDVFFWGGVCGGCNVGVFLIRSWRVGWVY